MNNKAYIYKPLRTALGGCPGFFTTVGLHMLCKEVIKSYLFQIPEIIGDIKQIILAGNISNNDLYVYKQIFIECGIGENVNVVSLYKMCASSLEGINYAQNMIECGYDSPILLLSADIVSSSQYHLANIKESYKRYLKNELLEIDEIKVKLSDVELAYSCELLADRYNISKEEMDQYVDLDYQIACNANKNREFQREILNLDIENYIPEDQCFSSNKSKNYINDVSLSVQNGVITGYNSACFADAAILTCIIPESYKKREQELKVIEVIDCVSKGVSYNNYGLGALEATKCLLKKNDMKTHEIDLYEVNEGVAAQAIIYMKELELTREKYNPRGGSITLGYPGTCAGGRTLVSGCNMMLRNSFRYVVIASCAGAGMGNAVMLKNSIYK